MFFIFEYIYIYNYIYIYYIYIYYYIHHEKNICSYIYIICFFKDLSKLILINLYQRYICIVDIQI